MWIAAAVFLVGAIRYGCGAVAARLPNSKWLAGVLFLLSALLAVPASAYGPDLLLRQGRLCDEEQRFCLRGTIRYYPNSRLIEINGRVARAPGPGWVSILFRGSDRNNQPSTAVMEFPVRGDATEIIDRRFITDYPQVNQWRIIGMIFEPDPNAVDAARNQ